MILLQDLDMIHLPLFKIFLQTNYIFYIIYYGIISMRKLFFIAFLRLYLLLITTSLMIYLHSIVLTLMLLPVVPLPLTQLFLLLLLLISIKPQPSYDIRIVMTSTMILALRITMMTSTMLSTSDRSTTFSTMVASIGSRHYTRGIDFSQCDSHGRTEMIWALRAKEMVTEAIDSELNVMGWMGK